MAIWLGGIPWYTTFSDTAICLDGSFLPVACNPFTWRVSGWPMVFMTHLRPVQQALFSQLNKDNGATNIEIWWLMMVNGDY